MQEVLLKKIEKAVSTEDKINKTREFLQILCLKIMFDRGVFDNLAFVGGTALRILYDLKRYSEDLDFSLILQKGYSFGNMLKELTYELEKNGLKVEATKKETKIVHSSMIKFPGLLNELRISDIKEQKLSIKLEIDTNPPKGWGLQTSPVTESFVFAVKHFDLPSLFATKLHACFFRRYIKGRDFYDLIWYLGKKVIPNFILLNNAIQQTEGPSHEIIDIKNLKDFMKRKLDKTDFKPVIKDVERFLENKSELKLLTKEYLLQMTDSIGS
jgi:predicted nucleotidyltransferase component of viral defense system